MYKTDYTQYTDREIVEEILAGNEEAALFLLHEKYVKDLRYLVNKYYQSLSYLDELTDELYILLKGKKGDWIPLRNFNWQSSLRTWLCTVASHLFITKKKEMIDFTIENSSILNESIYTKDYVQRRGDNQVILMEAINRLQNDVYKFILIKELEGYNQKEIAEMLAEKRRIDKTSRKYKGNEVVPNAGYVSLNKARAMKELKKMVEIVKNEWYGNKC